MAGEIITVTITEQVQQVIDVTVDDPEAQVIDVSIDNPEVTPANVEAAGALMKAAGGASVENLGSVEETVNVLGATGASAALDVSLYGAFDYTMDQNCTLSFTNPAPSGNSSSFMLILRGAFTPTFPAAVVWAGGTPPTYETPSLYTFTTVDGGTTWFGGLVGSGFA